MYVLVLWVMVVVELSCMLSDLSCAICMTISMCMCMLCGFNDDGLVSVRVEVR